MAEHSEELEAVDPSRGEREHVLYWWHHRILDEMRRLHDGWGVGASPIGIAANLNVPTAEAARHMAQLADAGRLIRGDYSPNTGHWFYRLADVEAAEFASCGHPADVHEGCDCD